MAPVWNETFCFKVEQESMHLLIMNENVTKDSVNSECTLDLHAFVLGTETEHDFPLT